MPVDVIGLAAEEVVEGAFASEPGGQGGDLRRDPEHPLVKVVDLAVLDLEVAPRGAPKPAGLGPALGAGPRRAASGGGWRGEPVGGRRGGQPAGVGLEGLEEAVDPALLAPAVLPRRGPGAEFLAVVAHRAQASAVVGGGVPEVGD